MIVGFAKTKDFRICVMNLMEKLKDKIKTAEDLEQFSIELHESIEIVIMDMLKVGNYGINPYDYNSQFCGGVQERSGKVRGYWKKDPQFSSVFCSKCGFSAVEQYICDSIPPKQYLSEYCPWCGSKMDEEVKQDDRKGTAY